ncbi:multidrug resistance outer membrane protein (plasmid) [Azospirillum sp. B510]|uniref:efflux transporter outer membrane subunit n=1 Tax=Azospirillum sp. (strain B510) TaxID=137722 RepID=UPI0001C4CCB0|nr:efflux transporter outer membrane subunit [Azospirillum sp. B510]BAI75421.1 multidrug resistance outer membrane protein [Azospirillum sp. B510]
MTALRKAHRRPALLASLCGAALLAGCSLAPPYERPAAPIPASYPAPVTLPGPPRNAAPWCARQPDPRLERLIAAALEHNRDLRLAVARVAEARAQSGFQSATRRPAVSLEATSTNPPQDNDSAQQLGLALSSYELDFFDKAKNLSDAALHELLATEQAQRTARVSLIAEVARAYVTERAADARATIARRAIASRKAGVALLDRRLAAGASSPLEVQQARTLVASAEADLIEQELTRERAANQLALLTGYSGGGAGGDDARTAPAFGTAAFAAGWGPLQPGLPSELLTKRPDIMAAEQRLMAANAQIGAARAAFFPSIRLTTMAGLASNELHSLFRVGSGAWQFVPQISIPLFDGGRNQANLDLAKARESIAVVEYERTIQTAFREVADALAGQTMLERDAAARRTMRELEGKRHALTMKRYLAGAVGYLEVLDAERGLFAADQALIDAQRGRLENAVALYRALGGFGEGCRQASG